MMRHEALNCEKGSNRLNWGKSDDDYAATEGVAEVDPFRECAAYHGRQQSVLAIPRSNSCTISSNNGVNGLLFAGRRRVRGVEKSRA
jgi:hypothetical protein